MGQSSYDGGHALLWVHIRPSQLGGVKLGLACYTLWSPPAEGRSRPLYGKFVRFQIGLSPFLALEPLPINWIYILDLFVLNMSLNLFKI